MMKCPSCGGETWRSNENDPDPDWRSNERATDESPSAGVFAANDKVDGWRFDRFVTLGLDVERASRAAVERNGVDGGFRVDLHVFEDLVHPKQPDRKPCDALTAFEILF
jgi:hypothetical protein